MASFYFDRFRFNVFVKTLPHINNKLSFAQTPIHIFNHLATAKVPNTSYHITYWNH